MNEFYTDYAEYLQRFFGKTKIQKISVNTGCGCPNRDGTLGVGGCIYCDNTAFTPSYCFERHDVAGQLQSGIRFFAGKYKDMKYLAYFQTFTSTYGQMTEQFRDQCAEALDVEGVVGLIIGTRPDCITDETIRILEEFNQHCPVFVEIGVETLHDDTLRLINRGHTAEQSLYALRRLTEAGLHTGVHLIAGLPGEDEEMTLQSVNRICRTGVESIKMHHLQVLRGTALQRMWNEGSVDINPWQLDKYLDFCIRVIDTVPRGIAIERFLASAPPQSVVAPKWGIKNYEFTNLLINKLRKR